MLIESEWAISLLLSPARRLAPCFSRPPGTDGGPSYSGDTMSVKLLIADDHEVVRTGLVSLLADTDIKIVGHADNGAEAVKMAVKHKPDVVLLDIRMPDSDGLEALEKIHNQLPDTRVVILSTYDN